MGVDLWNLRFLAEARKRSNGFGDTLQIGRQELHIAEAHYPIADAILRDIGLNGGYRHATGGNRYADEGLFQALGAKSVTAADASAYEGASLVHDFNEPISKHLHQRFDTIFDGGSLEHIFNVPTSLANEMNLIRTGGQLISSLPANNWLGHGFYQFSPELPFRVFNALNGFSLDAVFLAGGMESDDRLFQVDDLARRAGGEIGFTRSNTGLMFIATKTEHVEPFRRWPQQGDYRSAWEDFEPTHVDQRPTQGLRAKLRSFLSPFL